MKTYDAIVVGLGAMGSATAYQLARRGRRVLGLDAHGSGHSLGSSHGESRIIRMAYMEHPDYVPLLRRAYELWRQAEQEADRELMRLTGGVFIGAAESHVVAGSLRSAQEHGLPHELLEADELRCRYPALRPAEGDVALYEESAGLLFPERCIQAHLSLAERAGAQLHHEEAVRSWSATSYGVEVQTDAATYGAEQLVLTAGAWTGKLLADIGLPLQPERIPVYWLHPWESAALFDPDRFPIYIWDTGDGGSYYGFPHLSWPGVKVGRHHLGVSVDPDTVDRQPNAGDEAQVREFVASRIPALDGPVAHSVICLYTNTPDEHFIVDRHPVFPSVLYAAGFSGHGFKFASVIGEILADHVTTGQATPAADFLRFNRLQPLAPAAPAPDGPFRKRHVT